MIAAKEAALVEQRESMRCAVCGGQIEDLNSLLPACYGCRLDSLLPPSYPVRERYEYSCRSGQQRALAHPKTGVGTLDARSPHRVFEVAQYLSSTELIRLCALEQAMGLEDVYFCQN